jgi:GAF domain-containing protein
MTGPLGSSGDPSAVGAAGLAATLGRLCGVLLAEETVGSVLDLVTTLAAETLPGSFGAGVTLVDGSTRTSEAATDPLVEEADALQYELEEGPCLSAARDQVTYRIDSMWNERRWSHWTAAVARLGLGSSLSSPLVVRGDSLGAVKVYARPEEAFTDRDERILALFAEKASVILANARSQEELRRLNEHLRESLRTRDAIAQAKGILRERHHVDERSAFGMLAEWSQRTNRKVRDLAQEILASTGSSAPGPSSG